MSKLLRGQQLFISKHITSQIGHAVSPEPPDPRPPTDFIPCISSYSNGGQLMAVYDLGLSLVGQTAWYYHAHKLTDDSFTFPNLNQPIRPSAIGNYPTRLYVNLDAPVKTYNELQRRHIAHFHRTTWVQVINTWWPPWDFLWAKVSPGQPGFSLSGDTTTQTGAKVGIGSWKIAFTEAYPLPNDPHYTLVHEHPIGTTFEWREFTQGSYPMFICEKSLIGLHEIKHCHPNIEPI